MAQHANEKEAISNIQRYLRALISQQNTRIFSVPIDGIYDSATRNAISEFQKMYSLPVTGIVDKITFDMLFSEYTRTNRASERVTPSFFPNTPIGYETGLGERSFLVELIQFILGELRISYDSIPFFDRTGEFDRDTSNAIKEFQRLSSLPATGKVDAVTLNALSRAYNALYY